MKKAFIALIFLLTAVFPARVTPGEEKEAPARKAVKTENLPVDFTYDGKGTRDPFAPPGKGGGGAEEIQNLKVDGIISDANGISAVISGHMVKEGDKIFDAVVREIGSDFVILEYQKEKIELKTKKSE